MTKKTRARGKAKSPAGRERVLHGLGVSAGVAIGPVHVRESGAPNVPEYRVSAAGVAKERLRFTDAVAHARRQIEALKVQAAALPEAAAEEADALLDAYLQMLGGSRLVRGVERRIAEVRVNAEAAVMAELSEIAKSFASMDDPYLASRMQDIRDVGARIVRNLTKTPYQAFTRLPEGTVVLAENLTTSDTALMDPDHIAGIATVLGGAESHTAIMARSLGLPAVLGVAGLIGEVSSGEMIIVDGDRGRVVLDPAPGTFAEYEARRRDFRRSRRLLGRLARVPAVTSDGTAISLQANVDLPRELGVAVKAGATGIGLLRTEYMFMNRDDLPGEDEQYRMLAEMVDGMGGKQVTARTLDVGGDKLVPALAKHVGGGANPALGLRAIRLSLKERGLLETQLAAMLRAGAHGPIRILLPMISSVGEIRQVREVLGAVVKRLKRDKIAIADPLPPLGVMIEVPGAALAADALTRNADFFAIGTNDLTMYTLAIDRGDDRVAHLYDPLHPAVLRLIQFATEAALRARIPVSLCGEMAGDPRYTALLLGLGIRDLSMSAMALPQVKKRIRGMDLVAATGRARLILDQSDSGHITALLDDFNALA